MHEFALLAFGGLAVALVIRFVSQYGDMGRVPSVLLWLGLGVGYAYLTSYSIFDAWGIGVRSETVGSIMTGFMVGGMAMLWEEVIDFARSYAHRGHEEPKKTLRRAA